MRSHRAGTRATPYCSPLPKFTIPYLSSHRAYGASVRCFSSGFRDPDVRQAAKKLSFIFYKGDAGALTTGTADGAQPALSHLPTHGPPLHDLPLWRADSVVLVGQQALLHVHTPHYVHMFDRLFASGPGPWLFGHVRLPAGSRNLGLSEWALCVPGSRAPTIGVLMEVNRAVRLEDGKLMVLATALCRIQVLQCWHETPYSRAKVQLLHEEELLETWRSTALEAAIDAAMAVPAPAPLHPVSPSGAAVASEPRTWGAATHGVCQQQPNTDVASRGYATVGRDADPAMAAEVEAQASHDAGSVADVGVAMRVAAAATQAAATAAAWRWHSYEAFTARSSSWLGGGPAEGRGPADTRNLVTELIDHGVLSVVPFPDGPVVGRWDLAALSQAAAVDGTAAAATVAVELMRGERGAASQVQPTNQHGVGGPEAQASDVGQQAAPSADFGTTHGDSLGAARGVQAEAAVPQSTVQSTEASRSERDASGADAADLGADYRIPSSQPEATELSQPRAHSQVLPAAVEPGGTPSGAAGEPTGTDVSSDPLADVPSDPLAYLTGHTAYDLLALERQLWDELDMLAVLQARVRGQRLGLPLGLLQLRPSHELAAQQLAAAAREATELEVPAGMLRLGLSDEGLRGLAGSPAAADSDEDSTSSKRLHHDGTAQPRVHPASEGLDVYCHPDYPLQRRIMRLSHAAAATFFESQDTEARQQLLESTSVCIRLVEILRRARAARCVLAAMAAVKAL